MNISTSTLIPFAPGSGIAERIQSHVSFVDPHLLRIHYLASGNAARLKIPTPSPARHSDRLWEHTCFEAFIRVDRDPAYFEFNFSPSGEWAGYSFRGYRDGMANLNDGWTPEIVVCRTADAIELDAVVHLDCLSAIRTGSLLRIGLAAVIEAGDGRLSYWALKHPAAEPDFHHPDSFALELALPSQSA